MKQILENTIAKNSINEIIISNTSLSYKIAKLDNIGALRSITREQFNQKLAEISLENKK